MDKTHWGDPENFRPERFISPEGKFVKDVHLMLFGSGKTLATVIKCLFLNDNFYRYEAVSGRTVCSKLRFYICHFLCAKLQDGNSSSRPETIRRHSARIHLRPRAFQRHILKNVASFIYLEKRYCRIAEKKTEHELLSTYFSRIS